MCYRCGDTSHKISDCTFEENTKRNDSIRIRNEKWTKKKYSLKCLPIACYNVLS